MNRLPLSLFFFLTILVGGCCMAQPNESPLTTAAEVRSLTVQDAGRSKPVHLHGVVTYLAPNGTVFFLQDNTGGVCVTGPRDRQLKGELKLGSIVDVEGVS